MSGNFAEAFEVFQTGLFACTLSHQIDNSVDRRGTRKGIVKTEETFGSTINGQVFNRDSFPVGNHPSTS